MKLLFFIFLFLLGLEFLCLGPVKLSSSLSLVVFLPTSALQLETVRESYTHTDTHTHGISWLPENTLVSSPIHSLFLYYIPFSFQYFLSISSFSSSLFSPFSNCIYFWGSFRLALFPVFSVLDGLFRFVSIFDTLFCWVSHFVYILDIFFRLSARK